MIFWILTYFCLFLGLRELKGFWIKFSVYLSQNQTLIELRRSIQHLKLLQEMLESGVVPAADQWDHILKFPEPWGIVIFESFRELRNQGAPILPSLNRIQKTLEEQTEIIQEAKVKSSQSFGQAWMGLILIPIFALTLYCLMPGVRESGVQFILLSLLSLFLASIAFIWMISMVDRARFGGLSSTKRAWLLTVNSTLERILALISTGLPPDLAWRNAMEELSLRDPALVQAWKAKVWDSDFSINPETMNECERLILSVGVEVRRSIQTSLIEGRSCMDRIESIHRAFLVDLKMNISRELNLLPNRCLKPLFVFVLPSVLLLMFGTFALCFQGLMTT
jgi:hypothetical protein